MLKLFGPRKLSWNGLIYGKNGSVSSRQDCTFERKSIGEGASGVVHRGKYCMHFTTGDVIVNVAVKETTSESTTELENLVELKDEEEIIHLFNYAWYKHRHLFVIELCTGGDLLDYVLAHPLSTRDALHVIRWLICAVDKCHKHGIIHTDIKLENIGLLQPARLDKLRLLDFGLGKRIADAPFGAKQLRGSPHYVAPELDRKGTISDARDLCALDMWSVGIVAFALLEGEFYIGGRLTFKECTDVSAQELVRGLLCTSSDRWTTQQCLAHFTDK